MSAKDMIGKKIRFYWNNKQVEGKILKFKIPGYHVKVAGLKENPVVPAMALKLCKILSNKED